jgi:PAS domain S-box-containing protein
MSKKKIETNEIRCASQQIIVSRTDLEGNIIYHNPTFSEVNGFQGSSCIHKPHNIVRLPDMPKTIFKIIWSIIEQGLPIQAVLKNRTNDGHYYWTLINWKVQKDADNNAISYVAYGKQAPDHVIEKMEPLYAMMLDIEKEHGMDSALKYLHSFLEEEGVNYSQYMEKLIKHREFRCLCDFVKHTLSGTKKLKRKKRRN